MRMSRELDAFFRIGEQVELGSHRFTADEIKEFAAEFDPQVFHTDEDAAKDTLFGGLCASGWHSTAMWMRYNYAELQSVIETLWQGDGPRPQFGPSPGFKNLRWVKPVYAGDTVRFTRTAMSYRALASRPGWLMLEIKGEAFVAAELVMAFDNAVLVQHAG